MYVLRSDKDGYWIASLPVQNVLSIESDEATYTYRTVEIPEGQPDGDIGAWWEEFSLQLKEVLFVPTRLGGGTWGLVNWWNGVCDFLQDEGGRRTPVKPFLANPDLYVIDGKLPTFREWGSAVLSGDKDPQILGISGIGEKTLAKIKARLAS
jgi:hypothetical protein